MDVDRFYPLVEPGNKAGLEFVQRKLKNRLEISIHIPAGSILVDQRLEGFESVALSYELDHKKGLVISKIQIRRRLLPAAAGE